MTLTNLDMDVLRTLVTACRLGSFNRAAAQIGRSQSAVSQQIRKLEEQVGAALFLKQGRGLVLTEAGEVVLAYGRRILDLNDEVVSAVRGRAIEGTVRFGLPADFAEAWLPAALGRFARAHPAVRVEAVVDRNRRLLERLDAGELDLVLALDNQARSDAEAIGSLAPAWIGSPSMHPVLERGQPVSLAVFEAPCFFRRRAIEALDEARIAWRISFTSPSLHGLWAAVEAGLGVTLRTTIALPDRLTVLGKSAGLPSAQTSPLRACIHNGGRALTPAVVQLKAIIVETVQLLLPDGDPEANSRS